MDTEKRRDYSYSEYTQGQSFTQVFTKEMLEATSYKEAFEESSQPLEFENGSELSMAAESFQIESRLETISEVQKTNRLRAVCSGFIRKQPAVVATALTLAILLVLSPFFFSNLNREANRSKNVVYALEPNQTDLSVVQKEHREIISKAKKSKVKISKLKPEDNKLELKKTLAPPPLAILFDETKTQIEQKQQVITLTPTLTPSITITPTTTPSVTMTVTPTPKLKKVYHVALTPDSPPVSVVTPTPEQTEEQDSDKDEKVSETTPSEKESQENKNTEENTEVKDTEENKEAVVDTPTLTPSSTLTITLTPTPTVTLSPTSSPSPSPTEKVSNDSSILSNKPKDDVKPIDQGNDTSIDEDSSDFGKKDEDTSNRSEMELFYRIVSLEAGGWPYEGQLRTAQVIVNRKNAQGVSLRDILTAPGQFDTYTADIWNKPAPSSVTIQACNDALNGLGPLPANTMYFLTKVAYDNNAWFRNNTEIVEYYDNSVFARNK